MCDITDSNAHASPLQAFLRAIVAHPVPQQADATRVFMLQPGELANNPAWIAIFNRLQSKSAGEEGNPRALPRLGSFVLDNARDV